MLLLRGKTGQGMTMPIHHITYAGRTCNPNKGKAIFLFLFHPCSAAMLYIEGSTLVFCSSILCSTAHARTHCTFVLPLHQFASLAPLPSKHLHLSFTALLTEAQQPAASVRSNSALTPRQRNPPLPSTYALTEEALTHQ